MAGRRSEPDGGWEQDDPARQWQAFSLRLHDCKDRVVQKKNPEGLYFVEVPDTLRSVSSIEKDSKRFRTQVDVDMPSFCIMQRLIRSSLSGAIAHSGRKFVTRAIRL
jgi:hypothetical protein